MPTSADYAATASSVYDPQAAAESTQAGAARDTTVAGLGGADADINRSFSRTADTLKTARNDQAARTDFQYTTALEGNSSGLHENQDARESGDYLKTLEGLGEDVASRHSSITAQRQAAQSNYAATLQAITQKYSGLKSGFVSDMLSKDADRSFQERMANNANAASLAAAQAYAGNKTEDPGVSLNDDIYDSLNGFMVRPKGYSENTILPALYKQYGGKVPHDQITDAFYKARKALGYG